MAPRVGLPVKRLVACCEDQLFQQWRDLFKTLAASAQIREIPSRARPKAQRALAVNPCEAVTLLYLIGLWGWHLDGLSEPTAGLQHIGMSTD